MSNPIGECLERLKNPQAEYARQPKLELIIGDLRFEFNGTESDLQDAKLALTNRLIHRMEIDNEFGMPCAAAGYFRIKAEKTEAL